MKPLLIGLIFHYSIRHQLWDLHCPICVSGANIASHLVIYSKQSTCHPSSYCPAVKISRHNSMQGTGPSGRPSVNSLHMHKLACSPPQMLPQIAAADKRVEHHLPCTWSRRGWTRTERGREREEEIKGMKRATLYLLGGKEVSISRLVTQSSDYRGSGNPRKVKY